MASKPKGRSWEDRARLYLKAEIVKADITYEELAERLEKQGVKDSAAGIANKLSRGTFMASWFLAVLAALETESVQIKTLI